MFSDSAFYLGTRGLSNNKLRWSGRSTNFHAFVSSMFQLITIILIANIFYYMSQM